MLDATRRRQLTRYRADSDCINDLLLEIERLEVIQADVLANCEGLLDSSKWDDNSPGVALAVYIVKVMKA